MAVAWAESWDRAYRISFGVRNYDISKFYVVKEDIITVSSTSTDIDDSTVSVDATVLGNITADGFDKRGFTFKFDSTQALSKKSSDSEKTTLILYNITDDLLKLINTEGCIIFVEAGYDQSVELAYSGDVVNVKMTRSGGDKVYTITLTACGYAKRNTVGTCSYDESMSDKEVLEDLIGKLPGVTAPTTGLDDWATFFKTGGRNFNGQIIKNIERLLSKKNLSFTVVNGKMSVVPDEITGTNLTKLSKTKYELPLESLKAVTTVSNNSGVGSSTTASKKTQLQVNTFYIPVEPAQFINIPESEYTSDTNGDYLVKARRIVLESKGNAWDVILTVESLD